MVSLSSLPQSKIGSEEPIFASPLPEGAFGCGTNLYFPESGDCILPDLLLQ